MVLGVAVAEVLVGLSLAILARQGEACHIRQVVGSLEVLDYILGLVAGERLGQVCGRTFWSCSSDSYGEGEEVS